MDDVIAGALCAPSSSPPVALKRNGKREKTIKVSA